MNILDIEYKIKLDQAKTKTNNIESINNVAKQILQEVRNDGAERYRFWHRKLKKIHPLVDYYLSGQFASSPISDVTGEHILNLTADTQTVDLKYYSELIKNENGKVSNNGITPLPIRSSIRYKIPPEQLKMSEESYFKLNKSYSIIMSTFFNDPSNEPGGNPNNWVISRSLAHEYYNTQDYLGFSVKLFLYDTQYKTLVGKYGSDKLQLLDNITPVDEKIIIEHEKIIMTIEGKKMALDALGNKIIKMPTTVKKTILDPTSL